MPKTLLAMLLLLVTVVPVSAGPPEGMSGQMVLAPDPVKDGLRQYRQARDQAARLALLQKLAPTRDPRVALVIWEEIPQDRRIHTIWECRMVGLMNRHFVRGANGDGNELSVWDWWKANEADIRRRAKQLR